MASKEQAVKFNIYILYIILYKIDKFWTVKIWRPCGATQFKLDRQRKKYGLKRTVHVKIVDIKHNTRNILQR